MPKIYDILSIGSVYLDVNGLNFPFEDSIAANKETVGGSYLVTPGGSPTNFSKVAAFLGLKPVLIGKIGNDEIGSILTQKLEKKGITPALITSGSVQTNLGLNFINPAGVSVMTTIGTANQSLTGDDVMVKLKNYLPQVNYLYLGGFFKLKALIPHYAEMIKMAKEQGTRVILDHGRVTNISTGDERSALIALMPDVDIYLPSIDEFLDLWQSQNLEYAIEKARTVTGATIIVKQAESGATGNDHTQTLHIPAYPVAPINTVGAGDSFNAGFLKALSLGKNLEDAVRFANATAALVISQKTLPNIEAIETFITQHPQNHPSPQTSPISAPPKSITEPVLTPAVSEIPDTPAPMESLNEPKTPILQEPNELPVPTVTPDSIDTEPVSLTSEASSIPTADLTPDPSIVIKPLEDIATTQIEQTPKPLTIEPTPDLEPAPVTPITLTTSETNSPKPTEVISSSYTVPSSPLITEESSPAASPPSADQILQ